MLFLIIFNAILSAALVVLLKLYIELDKKFHRLDKSIDDLLLTNVTITDLMDSHYHDNQRHRGKL